MANKLIDRAVRLAARIANARATGRNESAEVLMGALRNTCLSLGDAFVAEMEEK